MTERMKQFLEAAIRNEETLEKMKSIKELSLAEQREQITALAAEVGVTLTEDDFKQIYGAELTDTELEQIVGGIDKYDQIHKELITIYVMKAINELMRKGGYTEEELEKMAEEMTDELMREHL